MTTRFVAACGGLVPSLLCAQAIHVTLLGTSGPSATSVIAEAGLLIEAGGEALLFDCGRGVPERLAALGSSKSGPRLGVSKVFLSHLHSDHTEGLPVLWMNANAWSSRGNSPLAVWGPGPDVDQPAATSELSGLLQLAFATDTHVRRDLVEHRPAGGIVIQAVEVSEGVVYQNNGITVTAFLVDHHPIRPAFGYRVDYAGHSVVFSGDTTRSDNLIKFAKGADVLIHEVLMPSPTPVQAIVDYHTLPEQAADVFSRAAPRLAVYTHIARANRLAPYDDATLINRTRAAGYAGRLEVGQDLMTIDVSDSIDVHRPSTCPNPQITAVTDASYGNNITAAGTLIVWGSGLTPSGGNSIQLARAGFDTVQLDEADGFYFWDQSANQMNAALGRRVDAGQWQITATNICGVASVPAVVTIR